MSRVNKGLSTVLAIKCRTSLPIAGHYRKLEERQDLYDRIASTIIPVIVYTGDENNLPEIFDRINSQGTPLDQYEVYAAAWTVKQKFSIINADIVEHVVRKYDTFEEDDFKIHGYNREEMRTQKTVNAFEYLFGLSKHLVEKYDILSFNRNLAEDTVNPLAFELVNACLNDTDRIKTLYQNLYALDVNAFEAALYKAIEFVRDSILVITKFKGNSRNANKIFHSKYQILSMISTTFKEMYAGVDYTHFSDTWQERKQKIARNLVQYYVYDIITNYWSEGGTGKIHSAAKPNRYMMEIPDRAWMVALDGFFERSMLRAEKKNIANPRSEEYGAQTLKILSKSLTKEFGKGFSRSNLQNMRSFYLNYPEFLKCQSATGKLTWTHYCELLSISDTDKRSFYEKECTNSGWSVRELKRQIESSLFERLLLSKGDANKEQVLAMASKGIDYTKPEDVIKDPYVFEFLGIPEDKPMLESDLENALVRQIEKFLLELGRGFMFVGTQQRVTVGNIHRYVDMVFYNKIFKAYVLIELKTVKLMPEAVGQLKK